MSYIFNMLGLESSGFILSLGITLVLTGLVVFYFKQQEKNTRSSGFAKVSLLRHEYFEFCHPGTPIYVSISRR